MNYQIDHIENGIIHLKEKRNWKERLRDFFRRVGLGIVIEIADTVFKSLLGWIWIPIKIFIQGIGWVDTNRKKKILIYADN